MKTFVFNSVNSFGSFVYIAYIRKEYDSGCMGACEHVTFGSAIQTDKCPNASALLDANGAISPKNTKPKSENKSSPIVSEEVDLDHNPELDDDLSKKFYANLQQNITMDEVDSDDEEGRND